MKISESLIYEVGDPVKFMANAAIKEGYGYREGIVYDGKIISHQEGYQTLVEIVGDNGQVVKITVGYSIFELGMKSITLALSAAELAERLDAWIEQAVADETTKYEDRVMELKSVTFW